MGPSRVRMHRATMGAPPQSLNALAFHPQFSLVRLEFYVRKLYFSLTERLRVTESRGLLLLSGD